MRVLVTGARGLLGAAIAREFAADHEVRPVDRARLDITDEAAVAALVSAERPDVIVNCAAYNDVDGAEDEAVLALRVNAFAVLALSRAATDAGATFVHFSTDFVFDGEHDQPYTETDRPNPRGTYAAAKLLGDWFALESATAYVLRVESLFGPPGLDTSRRGSLGTLVDRIRQGVEVPVFVDRVASPSHTPDIARAVRGLVERQAPPGLYHCVNSGHATWAEIATHAAAQLGVPLRSRPLTLETAALRARRPRFCALSNSKRAAAGVPMPTWQEALGAFLEDKTPAVRSARNFER
jgi:dTDP-4-dehydrorhamnose reductase